MTPRRVSVDTPEGASYNIYVLRGISIIVAAVFSLALMDGIARSVSGEMRVVATVLPVYVSAINVAGTRARVELLVPPGADVHEFQLTPGKARALHEADLVLMNGALLEPFIKPSNRVSDPSNRAVDTSSGIEFIYVGGSPDPHVWLDPLNVITQVQNIRDAMAGADPANAAYYEANAARYIGALRGLDRELEEGLSALKPRVLISHHEVFNYFARRYGLRARSLTGPHGGWTGPARLRAIYDIVKKEDVAAVFSERGLATAEGLMGLKREFGVAVCELDTVETGRPGAGRYIDAMRENLREITECLGR